MTRLDAEPPRSRNERSLCPFGVHAPVGPDLLLASNPSVVVREGSGCMRKLAALGIGLVGMFGVFQVGCSPIGQGHGPGHWVCPPHASCYRTGGGAGGSG